jgi:hypothetical protein
LKYVGTAAFGCPPSEARHILKAVSVKLAAFFLQSNRKMAHRDISIAIPPSDPGCNHS